MKHLKPFNENNVPTYSKEQIKEIAKKYVDFNILNDLIHLCTEYNDMGKETIINVSLEGNVSYVVYNSDDGWKSYESNIQFSVRDMLTQFLNSGKKFTKIRYTVMVLYKYSVNLISNRNEKEAIEIVTIIANKLNSKYKNLYIGEVQSGFFSLDSSELSAFVGIYKDL